MGITKSYQINYCGSSVATISITQNEEIKIVKTERQYSECKTESGKLKVEVIRGYCEIKEYSNSLSDKTIIENLFQYLAPNPNKYNPIDFVFNEM